MSETQFRTPTYPGDSVVLHLLKRGEELGDVRVQDYGEVTHDQYCVGSFLPGIVECSPGDTPKVWPEEQSWHATPLAAITSFHCQLDKAHALGWEDYTP